MDKIKPIQSLTLKEKLKKSYTNTTNVSDWLMQNVDYYIQKSEKGYTGTNVNYGVQIQKIINAIGGEINTEDYDYILNPYKSPDVQGRKYPAKLRNYDIITPVKNSLLGERVGMNTEFTVICTNSDVVNVFKEYQKTLLFNNYQNQVINGLQKYGLIDITNEETVQPYQDLLQNSLVSFQDIRAITGQEVLTYIINNIKFDEITQQLYDDYFDVGFFCTYKYTHKNDIYYERVNPADIWWEGSSEIDYIEDSEAVVRRMYLSVTEIVDKFNVTSDDVKLFEQKENINNNVSGHVPITYQKYNKSIITGSNYNCYHVVWKSLKKVGILTYKDEFNTITVKRVEEDYKLQKDIGDISIEYTYENEWWECYKLHDLYKFGRIGLVQRNDLNNNSICKLPYNGRKLYKKYNDIYSIGKIGLTYQILYNIFHYKFELIMNKNKESLMLMPVGLKPSDWTMEKWLYFVDSTGFAWFDEKNANTQTVLNSLKSINLSLANYAESMINFMGALKQEWWDYVGMNRQRYGDAKASDGKGVSEQAIYRSSVITAEFNRKFDAFIETELNALLDFSKIAYIDGLKSQYITSEKFKSIVDIEGYNHTNNSYGCFVKYSGKELEKRNQVKQLLLTLGQNGTSGSDLIEILDADTVSKMKEIVKKGEALQQQIEQSRQENEYNNQMALEEKIKERESINNEVKMYISDNSYKAIIDSATINASAKIETANNFEQNHLIDTENAQNNLNKVLNDIEVKNKEREHKIKHDNKKLELENKKIENNYKIAKENKNKYDKK